MLRVRGAKQCLKLQRAVALLEIRRVDYRVQYEAALVRVPELLSPCGQCLGRADDIVEYINDRWGPWPPAGCAKQRAIVRVWRHLAIKSDGIQGQTRYNGDERSLLDVLGDLDKAYEAVELLLGAAPYFHGDTPGEVDMAWLPLLHQLAGIEQQTGIDFLDCYPKTSAWQRRLLSTTLARRIVREEDKQAFAEYYLAEGAYQFH